MQLLLSFLPFLAFAVRISELGSIAALLLGALASAILVGHGLASGRSAKLLEVGSIALFAALAAFEYVSGTRLSLIGAKFAVDFGLLLIVVFSVVIGRPFTLQYAKESVSPAIWSSPAFKRKNDMISLVWAAAFLAMVGAELAMLVWPTLSHRLPVLVIVLALVGAFKFTQSQRKAGAAGSIEHS